VDGEVIFSFLLLAIITSLVPALPAFFGGVLFPRHALLVALISTTGWAGLSLVQAIEPVQQLPFALLIAVIGLIPAMIAATIGVEIRGKLAKES
jgi:hypothetical protein